MLEILSRVRALFYCCCFFFVNRQKFAFHHRCHARLYGKPLVGFVPDPLPDLLNVEVFVELRLYFPEIS